MAKIDLNSSENLIRLKKNMEEILESRIQSALNKESISSLEKLPFGTIKNVFEGIVDKLSGDKDGERLIGKYVRLIKEDKNLRAIYSIYDVIENPSYLSDSNLFLSEALEIAGTINKKEYNGAKKSVVKVIKECVNKSGVKNDELQSLINKNKELHESINYLLTTNKKASNIFDYVNKMAYVNKYLNENAKKEAETAENRSVNEIAKELTDTLNCLDEAESIAMKDLALVELSNGNKKELFERYKKDCLDTMEQVLESMTDVNEKSRVFSMKTQLESKEFSEECLSEDLVNLIKLNKTLLN